MTREEYQRALSSLRDYAIQNNCNSQKIGYSLNVMSQLINEHFEETEIVIWGNAEPKTRCKRCGSGISPVWLCCPYCGRRIKK